MPAVYSRRSFAVALFFSASAFAKKPVDPVNASRGLAIKGYDPVSYFDSTEPTKGEKQYVFEWMGAQWRFTSAEHRAKFQGDPERYAPQFGGYCAYAVSENYTADIDPAAWTIRNGKLYLNYSKKVRDLWLEDADGRITAAERNWPGLHR